MPKSLNELEIQPDATTVFQKNGFITFSRTFLIGFISYLQVTMIYIRALMSSKFGKIQPWTTELAALECLKKIP